MDLKFNSKKIATLSPLQMKVIKNDIPEDIFEKDMLRRCEGWLKMPVEKYVHHQKNKIIADLKAKGEKTIPVDEMELVGRFVDLFPPRHGCEDIKGALECSVGNHKFSLCASCRKGWRRINEKMQEKMGKEDYLLAEEQNLCDRMAWILTHKYERCLERLKREWLPKLAQRGVKEVPSDDEKLCELIFFQEDYLSRSQRDQLADQEEHLKRTGQA